MTFQADQIDTFLSHFHNNKDAIRAFPGCQRLALVQDREQEEILFTISEWEDPEALEAYRKSELFRSTWQRVKPLFAAKAEAWSVSTLWQNPEWI